MLALQLCNGTRRYPGELLKFKSSNSGKFNTGHIKISNRIPAALLYIGVSRIVLFESWDML